MPVSPVIIEEAIHDVLLNPSFSNTQYSRIGSTLLSLGPTVHVGYKPQSETSTYAITIERLGGEDLDNVDSFNRANAVVDLTMWTKHQDGRRANRKTLYQIAELVRLVIAGLKGIHSTGVEFTGVAPEGEFVLDETPANDASDGWIANLYQSYQFFYRRTNAANRTVTI